MADEPAFTGFVTAGSKKAVRPSAAPFDPFADAAAPAPTPASGAALFQTAGARRPWVRHMQQMAASLRAAELPNRTRHRLMYEAAARNACRALFASSAAELAGMPRLY